MKRLIAALALGLTVTAAPCMAAEIYIDGSAANVETIVEQNTTYVGLRQLINHLDPDAYVAWETDRAVIRSDTLTLTAVPGALYIEANGRTLFVPLGVWLEDGKTWLPVRALCAALDAEVDWDAENGHVLITSGSGAIQPGSSYYDTDELFWLSRIISAESQGEPLTGKLAVGNVILNRVAHSDFPDTIYGVIFDDRWGGQFEPVRNGTVYDEPTSESVTAAKLVLEGADVVRDSLYFLAPSLTDNHWIMENRDYVTTIGVHWFYR